MSDNNALFDACRDKEIQRQNDLFDARLRAERAEAERQEEARKAPGRALLAVWGPKLGFTPTANGMWVRPCCCGGQLLLRTRDGNICVGELDRGPACDGMQEIVQRLADEGFEEITTGGAS